MARIEVLVAQPELWLCAYTGLTKTSEPRRVSQKAADGSTRAATARSCASHGLTRSAQACLALVTYRKDADADLGVNEHRLLHLVRPLVQADGYQPACTQEPALPSVLTTDSRVSLRSGPCLRVMAAGAGLLNPNSHSDCSRAGARAHAAGRAARCFAMRCCPS